MREGDVVLMGSSNRDDDIPWIEGDTAYWLAEKKIKMLGVGVPGIRWETKQLDPEPDNCPTAPGDGPAPTSPSSTRWSISKP